MIALFAAWVDPSTMFGVASLVLAPMLAIASGWAIKNSGAAKAAREGMDIAYTRLDQANKWNKEVEHRNVDLEARFTQQENMISLLTDRIQVQDSRVSQLLEQTPEHLWQAVMQHSEAAETHWQHERAMLVKLDLIIDRLERIENGVA